MPVVRGVHYPYSQKGRAAANKAAGKSLPAQASPTAKGRAFGQRGAAKRATPKAPSGGTVTIPVVRPPGYKAPKKR